MQRIKRKEPQMFREEMDALSLEYKRNYGTACGDVNISDIINNPNAFGVISVFGPGFSEKLTDLLFVEIGVLSDNCSDT